VEAPLDAAEAPPDPLEALLDGLESTTIGSEQAAWAARRSRAQEAQERFMGWRAPPAPGRLKINLRRR
jgi:hypothetical protein